jgi:hypothetical protein
MRLFWEEGYISRLTNDIRIGQPQGCTLESLPAPNRDDHADALSYLLKRAGLIPNKSEKFI